MVPSGGMREADAMNKVASRTPGSSVLIGIGIAVALLIIVALALSQRGLQRFDPGTPEAAAQAYVQALFDEDYETAHTYLSTELQAQCRSDELRVYGLQDAATFDEVRRDGDRAEIELRLTDTKYYPGLYPFDDYRWSTETELVLERIDGTWQITDAAWPVYRCGRF